MIEGALSIAFGVACGAVALALGAGTAAAFGVSMVASFFAASALDA